MIFLNVSVLALGSLLVGIPIALHLVMKREPKPLIFPAIRFIRQKSEDNRRRLQLKHLLLLLLRCAAVVIPAAALARPSVASATLGNWLLVVLAGGAGLGVLLLAGVGATRKMARGILIGLAGLAVILLLTSAALALSALSDSASKLIGHEETPVAAAIVVDTSPHMLYRHQNQTRLEVARETASWLLGELPHESQIGVIDARGAATAMAADLATARAAVERLQVTFAPRSLESALESAFDLVQRSELARKEVYILTDLAKNAWDFDAAALQRRLVAAQGVQIYVIDVGIEAPQNFSLGSLELSSQSLAKNSPLTIAAEVRAQGTGGGRLVDLYLEEPDPQRPTIRDGKPLLPEPRRRGREAITLETGGVQRVQFDLQGLASGTYQGYVEIDGEDGLQLDDRRYFTVEVRPPLKVLIAAPTNTVSSFLSEALAPYEFRKTGQARFDVTVIPITDLPAQELRPYAAVCLLDPTPLPSATWLALASYVKDGGGLNIFLGSQAQPVAPFNEPEPQQLLPGKLLTQSRPPEPVYLAPRPQEHPLLARFRPIETSLPWGEFPIQRYWALKGPPTGTIVAYSNGRPALVEKLLGQGRVLTFTTPFSEPSQPVGREPWNQLATGFEPWPFLMLANEMLLYSIGNGETKLNYLSGEPAELPNPPDQFPSRYQLFTPQTLDQDVAADKGRLAIRFAEAPGAYRLKGRLKEKDETVIRGFCFNVSPEATSLVRTEKTRLDEIWGAGKYQLARSRAEIHRELGDARSGREFFQYLLLAFALLVGLEQLFSNRFYQGEKRARPTAAALARELAHTA